jgi:hypothetical protein
MSFSSSSAFHSELRKRHKASLKRVNVILRRDEDNVRKANGPKQYLEAKWHANDARRDVLEQRRVETERKRDEIKVLMKEMNVLIVHVNGLTDQGQIKEERRAIRRIASKVDKKVEDISHV